MFAPLLPQQGAAVLAQVVEDLSDLTPKQVVERLDRNIVGQTDAKKAVRPRVMPAPCSCLC